MTTTRLVSLTLASTLALALGACGRGGDDELIRRVAAAEAAAARAEKAQLAAESAAARAATPAMADDLDENGDEIEEPEEAEFDPDSQVFDNTIVSPQPPPQTVVQG
ncbi:MAG TPA: hypothetical protein VM055_01750 [Novosphingobium sp.]|nr:hypothetical protein [Novosphingobium sp.]